MATLAYVEVQDVRFTEKQLGNNIRVYYTNGATLAASAALNGSNWDVTVQIVNNVTTAAQLIAAVNASATASAVVTASLKSGSTSTTKQWACKDATLSGGVAASYATVTIDGCMVLTAKTVGTGGNAITIVFEDGETAGSETCEVSTNAITVGIEDGVSTYAQVKDAIDNTVAAAALVEVTNNGVPLSERLARVSAAPSAVSLSGGVAAAAASVIVKDLTFASDVTGTSGNGATVSYTTGATAGAEVVTVDGSDISIQIENGVSTATQVKAAFDASDDANGAYATATVEVVDYAELGLAVLNVNGTVLTEGTDWTAATSNEATATSLESAIEAVTGINSSADGAVITISSATRGSAGNALTLATSDAVNLEISGGLFTGGTDAFSCTISGTGSNAQYTVNGSTLSGAVGTPLGYYNTSNATTALTSSFVRFSMPFPAQKIEINNDETGGAKTVIISLDGTTTDTTLTYGESISYSTDTSYLNAVWLKFGTDAPAYRLKAYGV